MFSLLQGSIRVSSKELPLISLVVAMVKVALLG